jgi:hypothetical protein
MTRDRDTYDAFQPLDRGRFGDNESAATIRGNDSVRSDLVDVTVFFIRETDKAIGIGRTNSVGPVLYLPKSQIEYEPKAPMSGQAIEVAMPKWLAKEKGLV